MKLKTIEKDSRTLFIDEYYVVTLEQPNEIIIIKNKGPQILRDGTIDTDRIQGPRISTASGKQDYKHIFNSGAGFNTGTRTIRLATAEEIKWLLLCIKNDKFMKKPLTDYEEMVLTMRNEIKE